MTQYARKLNHQGAEVAENASESMSSDVSANTNAEYEAPLIESVVTAENLEREVQYAGTFTGLA